MFFENSATYIFIQIAKKWSCYLNYVKLCLCNLIFLCLFLLFLMFIIFLFFSNFCQFFQDSTNPPSSFFLYSGT